MGSSWDELEKYAAQYAAGGLDEEHERRDMPSESVLLRRTFGGHTEHLWVQGYPQLRMIVHTFPRVQLGNGQTLPGAVRELPVGWRAMASAEAFSSVLHGHVASYLREGWRRA